MQATEELAIRHPPIKNSTHNKVQFYSLWLFLLYIGNKTSMVVILRINCLYEDSERCLLQWPTMPSMRPRALKTNHSEPPQSVHYDLRRRQSSNNHIRDRDAKFSQIRYLYVLVVVDSRQESYYLGQNNKDP